MSAFISRSINGEDQLLDTLFGNQDTGFFVDVGANLPILGNDTYALYQRGWRGINVDPCLKAYQALVAERPEDVNLHLAVSDVPGELMFYEIQGFNMQSTCDLELAMAYLAKGYRFVAHKVEARTLASIMEEHAPAEIDFLKIDVEHFEYRVLKSNDWTRFRPKLIMVECMEPLHGEPYGPEADTLLTTVGYKWVHDDGGNAWYLRV